MTANKIRAGAIVVLALAIGGCATVPGPNAPSVVALPGTYVPPDQFRVDDESCRQHAVVAIGNTTPAQAAENAAAANVAGGTLYGAATGALIGSASAQAGPGAAIGAGIGLLFGALAGNNAAAATGYGAQRAYDSAYLQCMYAKGNRVPGRAVYQAPRYPTNPAPSSRSYPPPS